MNDQPIADPLLRPPSQADEPDGFWKAGGWLALMNTLLIFMFFATAWASATGNRILFETKGYMLPVVPMVILLFIVVSLLLWFFAGKRLQTQGKRRFLSAMIGTTPIMAGIVLAAVAAVGSIIMGVANPGAVVVPVIASILAFGASAIFVIVIQVTQ